MRRGLLLLFCLPVLTTQADKHLSDSTFNINEVVITGTRTPKLLKDAPVQTRLITEEDIQKADATNIQDLLQTEMPGIEFSYAKNQLPHFNFAGFGGQGVLFLVDGERLAGETMDDVDFQRLTMSGVKRIEIVRSASSALYGSNASGGVINIITKEGKKPWALNVNARVGKHNHQRYGALWSLSRKRWSNTLDFSYSGTDNYDVSNGPQPQTHVFSTVYGDKNYHVKDHFTIHPFDRLKISGHAGYFFRTVTRNADTPERYRDFSGRLKTDWTLSDKDQLEVSYRFDEYDKSDYQKLTGLDIRDYSNVQNAFRTLWNHEINEKGTLTVGGDFMHDYLLNVNLEGKAHEQDCFDIFGQMDWNLNERWELVGALRYDYFSDRKHSRLTPKVSARYHANQYLTLRMAYGMGFRAPTLKEKYYNFDMAGIWILRGNTNLKPETSHNINLSAEWTKGNYNITASTYYNKVDHKLTTGIPHYLPGDNKQLYLDYLNLGDYSVYGAEATAQARWSNGFGARLSYAFTKEQLPKDDQGNAINNQYIPAREHAITTRLEWGHRWNKDYRLDIELFGRFLSSIKNKEFVDYYDISKGTTIVKYPAYMLWKLITSHQIGKAVRLTVTVDNLLNYKPKYYYLNAPITDGTSLLMGVSIDLD